ncbi:glycoside hydrolase family 20 zincin-like fold domain-containing protein [Streptomyces sp. NPDC079020]|uniref:glycoside hydrolase family 20 zincin-like fold domain-containing protein n=1 Tax=Streptomyces sp. NPDC079020 TaxID=3365722 RepID=UPI0037D6966C
MPYVPGRCGALRRRAVRRDSRRPLRGLRPLRRRPAGSRADGVVRGDGPARQGLTVHVRDAAALAAQDLRGPQDLPADGYVLGIGAGRIVLAGKDTTGTYYAAQALRQILPQHRRRPCASSGAGGPAPHRRSPR